MKGVLDLTKAIQNKKYLVDGKLNYFDEQFSENGIEKNILFVSPQLTSKHLYKYILPFFCFHNAQNRTAITELTKFDPYRQIMGLTPQLTSTEINWADFIVFPFTTHDLSKEYDLYGAVRETNPQAKIVFYIDFNFYEVPVGHPYHDLFKNEKIINQTERNILNADLVIVNNMELHKYIYEKFQHLAETKYTDIQSAPVICYLPYLIDREIVEQNKEIDFELNQPKPVINKEIFKKVAEVAEELKKDDLKKSKDELAEMESRLSKLKIKKSVTKKEEKIIDELKSSIASYKRKLSKLKDAKSAPKKLTTKTQKVTAKSDDKLQTKQEELVTPAIINEKPTAAPLPKNYRIGIICSPTNYIDIQSYNAEFQKINEMYGEQVSLIFIGYDYEEDKNKILDGVNFEYIKQISIIHYFKQISELKLDMVFIPVVNNIFNATSENTNKYLECGIFNIPVMVTDIAPYNTIIRDRYNGFVFKEKSDFIKLLDETLRNEPMMKKNGENSFKEVVEKYTYTDKNIEIMSNIFSVTYSILNEGGEYLFFNKEAKQFYFHQADEGNSNYCIWTSRLKVDKFVREANFPFPVIINKM